jgi:NTE family protein
MISTKNALVLAGGGVAGIAWETGFLLGLQDEAPDIAAQLLAPSTTLIGTSAGSTVAAQIATGNDLQALFDTQVGPTTAEVSATIDLAQFGAVMAEAMQGASSPEQVRQRIGAVALQAETPPVSVRRAVIEARLTQDEWPEWPLLITAVDTGTGEARVFDRTSRTNLVDVVSASCAVPGVWPPVEIDGRVYMDGGIRSLANADLAEGAERVLVLVPSAPESPLGQAVPEAQLDALHDARVHIVFADAASLEAMGANALDPESRVPSAKAGREQGRRQAAGFASFWTE